MRYFLLILAVVMGQSVLAADKKPRITDPDLEEAIRSKYSLNKPTGKLTKADLEKVTVLDLSGTQISDTGLKEVAKLKRLLRLYLSNTKNTDAA